MAAVAIGLGGLAPVAYADDLTDQRDRVNRQLAQSQSNLHESNTALNAAADALARSQADLAEARSALAQTQAQLADAREKDSAMAAALATAQNDLERARAAVAQAELDVADEQAKVGDIVRTQYQQKTGLVGIGMLVSGQSTGEVGTRMQWSTTMFDTTQAEMDRLKATQARLTAAKDAQTAVEARVAADRQTAAQNLETQRQLEASARSQTNRIASLVNANAVAQSAAQNQVEAERNNLDGLNSERNDVERRIAERIAAQRAEEARIAAENAARAVAERQAREAAARARAEADAAARRARAAQQAAEEAAARPAPRAAAPAPKAAAPAPKAAAPAPRAEAPAPAPRAAAPAPAPAAPAPVNMTAARATEHHGFIWPSGSAITSQFGMRLHPVLRYWKLHDGTDFGAACGSPILAPYDGVVKERYYNAGYGNRLIIDHGRVDGRFVTTALNHAITYNVSPGQRVRKGQVVGSVGSTGYSTGCHLHYMVWLDGDLTNPISWY
ncbi:peptidoglycan DD-metalloendopeptidase family protein [Mariniluteicoccus flavus]